MMATTTAPDTETSDVIPAAIDADSTKLVYLFLDVHGESTVSDIATSLGMTKLSLFSILDTLAGKGLVEGDGHEYRTTA
jgi:predicted transcriptional regulator